MLNTIGASSIQYQRIGKFRSDGVQPGFPGSDTNGFLDIGDEDLAVADAAGLGRAPDRVDGFLDQVVPDHDLDFDLGQKVDDIFRAPVKFGVTLLPAKALGLGNGDALQPYFLKRLFHLVELERLDDGFDFFHLTPPAHFNIPDRSFFTLRDAPLVRPSATPLGPPAGS